MKLWLTSVFALSIMASGVRAGIIDFNSAVLSTATYNFQYYDGPPPPPYFGTSWYDGGGNTSYG
jgi:hypothetical protein